MSLCVCPSLCPSVFLSVSLYVCPLLSLRAFVLPLRPPVYLFVCLYPSVRRFVCLSVRQWICWRQVGDEIREVGQGSVRRKRQRDKTVYQVFFVGDRPARRGRRRRCSKRRKRGGGEERRRKREGGVRIQKDVELSAASRPRCSKETHCLMNNTTRRRGGAGATTPTPPCTSELDAKAINLKPH